MMIEETKLETKEVMRMQQFAMINHFPYSYGAVHT